MKSHASDFLVLAANVLRDCAAKCVVEYSDVERDLVTLKSRVEHEGLSFLTITLPEFGADLEKALDSGQIGPTQFRSFRKSGRAPAFLRGFLGLVFDRSTGRLLAEPCTISIACMRQVAYTFKKVKLECTPPRVHKALLGFVEDEQIFDVPLAESDIADFLAVSDILWSEVFGRELNRSELIPSHGPGATAEKLNGNAKFSTPRWHDRLEPYFPVLDYLVCSYDPETFGPRLEELTVVAAPDEQPVRVRTVAKTLKKPRIIAIEPVCMMFVQQALKRFIYERLGRHALTRGHVNLTQQKVNRRLALASSITGKFATLDLSSASDRVPRDLALDMFRTNPELRGMVEACRSRRAQVEGPGVSTTLELRKFASMGSALCFPVEAMYFYTICVAALIRARSLPVTLRSIRKVRRSVFIFGDDILVPSGEATAVIEALHKYYCKVNASKSFWTGQFRESCGMDAYAGADVTPVYVRCIRPTDRQNSPKELVSWVATSNLFHKQGYWQTAAAMKAVVEKQLGSLPVVAPTSSGLGWHSFTGYHGGKIRGRYQRAEVLTWVASPVRTNDPIGKLLNAKQMRLAAHPSRTEARRNPMPEFNVSGGVSALTKCLLKLESRNMTLVYGRDEPVVEDERHLVRSVRRGAVTLKRRWTPPV